MEDIEGFSYIPDYISEEEELNILSTILDSKDWNTELSRRTLHYGCVYKYESGVATKVPDIYIDFPDCIYSLKLKVENTTCSDFDMAIVNEYIPGKGISGHIDCVKLFDDTLAIVSLKNKITLKMTHPDFPVSTILVSPRSLYSLKGKARYEYKHSIPYRKTDNGIPRHTRYSITFRKSLP